ncbi:hypothetical protein [Marinobacter gelidimuriae]|uniref:hypothetical protein n=1 Tax=Marinobacter gelidimuriae TaxID=2739064 RepID=UPI00037738ED|nr:hypothetical protein [Marinobacter gelidimuriae]
MNRFKKEEARAYQKTREGLSEADIKRVNEEEARNQQVSQLARTLHFELFPEESDNQLDSISDAADRRRGINPMNPEYAAKVNARREELRVTPLGKNGMPTADDSWDVAFREARKRVAGSESIRNYRAYAYRPRRPIDVTKANRPILILNEPQKMEDKATLETLPEFDPLFIIRYTLLTGKIGVQRAIY